MLRSCFKLSVGLVITLLSVHVTEAHAQSSEPHFYIAPFGGWAQPSDFANVEGRGSLAGQTFDDFDLKDGITAGAKLGFVPGRDSTWFNWELEYWYLRPDFKQQTVSGTTFIGSRTHVHIVSLNLIFRRHEGIFQPYAGIGGGGVFVRTSGLKVSGTTGTGNDTTEGVGINLLAGIRLMAHERFGLFAEFKHNRSTLLFDILKGRAKVSAGVVGLALHF